MHPDLPHEQAYFDRALALRDRQQADLTRTPGLAANPKAAVELRKRVSGLGLADPDEAIAFGRIETATDRWYIGKGAIWGDDNDLVVVNWQAPIAAPFYTATPDQPEGLDARRIYRCSGNQIREIEDLVFHEVSEAIANGRTPEPVLTDALLDSLGTARSGELGDIVATIQASQYEVISRPLDQVLVVQGGPGTGKTVVGLHRVSWLLFNLRDRLEGRDVLVVGPNPAFVRYASSVLPSLGDSAVVQLPLRSLGPRVRIGRVDPPAVRRLKGDRRLLRVVLRGLRYRQRIDASPVELTVDGRRVELDGRRLATRARQLAGRPHNESYRMLRAFLVAEVRSGLAGRSGTSSTLDEPSQGTIGHEVDTLLARVWPNLTPQAFLVDLLSSRRQLVAAGAGSLTEAELDMIALPSDAQVSTWQWSVDDVPLLDAADALLNGVPATYEHIVVDEAQDLSPLQLESIRRRSRTGSMTVLGDLAQGTSPWAHESWEPIVAALRHERVAATAVELEYGYRLPAEVHEVAMRLLPHASSGLTSPRPLRRSGHDVTVVRADPPEDLVNHVVDAVRSSVGDAIVGVITPTAVRGELVAALDDAGLAWAAELRPGAAPVVVLTPDEAKGLEFDVVVVVEPAEIVDECEHGERALFVALTRCTSCLAIVHARPLPEALGLGEPAEEPVDACAEGAGAPFGEDTQDAPGVGLASDARADVEPAADATNAFAAERAPVVQAPTAAAAPASTAEPEVGLDALDGLDRDIAVAIAGAVVAKLGQLVAPAMLPLVAETLSEALAARIAQGAAAGRADDDAGAARAATGSSSAAVDDPGRARPDDAGSAGTPGDESNGSAHPGARATGGLRAR